MRRNVSVILLATLVSTSGFAQETTPSAPPNPTRVTFVAGVDFPTAYVFRGILQEDKGFIAQPYVDFGVAVGPRVSVNIGTWNSPHTGPTGNWYEADVYGSATFTAGRFKPGLLFTSYTSPNDRFRTVHELAAVLAVDDSASPLPLSPKVVLAFDLSHGQADGGPKRGTYLELGVRPGVRLGESLSVSVPAKLGISLKNYYEGAVSSDRFGYFDLGVIAGVPLKFMDAGAWEVHGGVDMLWLGDNLKTLNRGGFKPIGVVGFSVTY